MDLQHDMVLQENFEKFVTASGGFWEHIATLAKISWRYPCEGAYQILFLIVQSLVGTFWKPQENFSVHNIQTFIMQIHPNNMM